MSRHIVIRDSDDEDSINDDLGLEHSALFIRGAVADSVTLSLSPTTQPQGEQYGSKRRKLHRESKERGSSVFIRSSSEIYESPQKQIPPDERDIPSSAPIVGSKGERARSRNAMIDSGIEVETPIAVRFKRVEGLEAEVATEIGKKSKGKKEKRKRREKSMAKQEVIDEQETSKQNTTIIIPILEDHFDCQVWEPQDETLGGEFETIDPARLVNDAKDLNTVKIENRAETDPSHVVEDAHEPASEESVLRSRSRPSQQRASSEGLGELDDITDLRRANDFRKAVKDYTHDTIQEQDPSLRKRGRPRKVNSQHNHTNTVSSHDIRRSMEDLSQGQPEPVEDETRTWKDDSIILETELAKASPLAREEVTAVEGAEEESSEKEVSKKHSSRARKGKKTKASKRSKRQTGQELITDEELNRNRGHESEKMILVEVDQQPTPRTEQSSALKEGTPNSSPRKKIWPDSDIPGTSTAAISLRTPEKPASTLFGSHSPLDSGKVPYRVGLSKHARIQPLLRIVKK